MKHFLSILTFFSLFIFFSTTYAIHPKIKKHAIGGELGVEVDATLSPELDQILINFKIPENVIVYSNLHGKAGMPMEIDVLDSINIKSWMANFPASVVQTNNGLVTYVYDKDIRATLNFIVEDLGRETEFSVKIKYSACGKICEMFEKVEHFAIAPNSISSNIKEHPLDDGIPLILIILFSLIGGFILNLMPCVLPVLSIKIFSIMNSPKFSMKEVKKDILATICGILISFMILAAVISLLKHLGNAVGWGMHFQSPTFLSFLILIIIIFANNLWGTFEISLPNKFQSKISNTSSSKRLLSNFLTGVLATILATPCTAPFLTTSVAFALSQGYLTIFIVYFLIGIGMSVPYISLLLMPKLLLLLPKPGKWMIILRKILAILLLLTAVWLMFVLASHLGFYGMVLFLGLMVILQALLSNPLKLHFYIKCMLIIAMICMITILPQIVLEQEKVKEHKVDSYWISFDRDLLRKYIDTGEVVLVDVTADWCITCKFNKLFVLDQLSLLEFLKQKKVILMRADLTNKSKEISDFLRENDRYGIPFNILYGAKLKSGIILPEILTRRSIENAVSSLLDR